MAMAARAAVLRVQCGGSISTAIRTPLHSVGSASAARWFSVLSPTPRRVPRHALPMLTPTCRGRSPCGITSPRSAAPFVASATDLRLVVASSRRHFADMGWRHQQRRTDAMDNTWLAAAAWMSMIGGVFALIPLYKMYCQSSGEGTAVVGHKEYSAPPEPGSAAASRLITVDFTGTVHTALPWEFVPEQRRVTVGLGETALAFYRARNNSDRPIIGVSVYHMLPAEAGLYFNKIQCFCFDEQLINPHEEVDLPIFFFIDPLMGVDSRFDHVQKITLSYLFFESDSDIPEGYEDYVRASPSKNQPSMGMPAPKPKELGHVGTVTIG